MGFVMAGIGVEVRQMGEVKERCAGHQFFFGQDCINIIVRRSHDKQLMDQPIRGQEEGGGSE
jgi:hypothetical protein